MIDKTAKPTKLLWVDLEMTGLDPVNCVIIEVAAIVTDFDFNKLASYEAVIYQTEEKLASLNEFSRNQFGGAGGLLEKVRASKKTETSVRAELASLINENFGDEPAVLAGNSIHQDRQFIREWWPEVDRLLHYRMLDVSAWKIVMETKYGLEFEKQEKHEAIADIEESIAELKYYLEWFRSS